jgi:hypothetical protein
VGGRSPSAHELRKSRTVVSSSFDRLAGQIDSEGDLMCCQGTQQCTCSYYTCQCNCCAECIWRRRERERSAQRTTQRREAPPSPGGLPAPRRSDRHPRRHSRRRHPLIWTTAWSTSVDGPRASPGVSLALPDQKRRRHDRGWSFVGGHELDAVRALGERPG